MQPEHGSSGMLLTEAAFGVASVVVYVTMAWLWKPGAAVNAQVAPAAA